MYLSRLPSALLGLLLVGAPLSAADERREVPSADDQARVEKVIKQLFAREYAVRSLAGYHALAVKLVDQAADTKDDPASRFVLYREAAMLAASSGDLDLANRAINEMSKHYVYSGSNLKARALEAAAARFTTVDASRILAEHSLAAASEAIDTDEFDAAARLLKLAGTTANKAKSIPLITSAQARVKEIEPLKAEHEKVKAVLERLKEKPDDPEANLTAGKYHCYRKGSWDIGLPHLAKGNDNKLKELATRDMAGPMVAPAQVEVGEEWLALSKAEKDMAAKHLQWRARHWFEKAVAGAEGETREKLEGYLKDIPVRPGASSLARVNLSDMEEFDVKVGYGKFAKGGRLGYNFAGVPGEAELTVKGKKYTNSLSSVPPSNGDAVIKYRLGKNATEFRSSVAFNDTAREARTPVTFKVLGDGKELWESQPVKAIGEIQECVVKVTGVDVLELRINCPGNHAFVHPLWLDPYIMTKSRGRIHTPLDASAGKQFVGVWLDATVAGQPGMTSVTTISNQAGKWSLQVQYVRRNQVVGLAVGTDMKLTGNQLTYGLHHVKKVAANWEDSTAVATVTGDKLQVKWSTGGASGTNVMTKVR